MKAFVWVLFTPFLLQTSECGRKAMERFVVGGGYASIQANPHSVFLSVFCATSWICGSAILNQKMLITAGHCLYGCDVRRHRIEVSAGSCNLKKVAIKRMVKRIVIHQKYVEKLVLNDIALALLDRAIPLGMNTKRIIIRKSFPFETPFGNVAGWGTVNEDTGATSIALKQVMQKLRSKVTCSKVGELIPGMFCAGSDNFYEDHPAEGDSGSALMTKAYTAIGIVSFRIPPYPALMVYTNLSYYYDWVTKTAEDMYCNR